MTAENEETKPKIKKINGKTYTVLNLDEKPSEVDERFHL